MPDYIYLLENRLSPDQQRALRQIGEAARDAGMTVFLTGGAVRDLTSGSSVRDLDVSVQGNALKLKKPLMKMGAILWGEHEPSRTLFFRFPVGVRVEVSSTRREEYPKPGKPVYHWDTILEDLRRRDFTANAMALSLNDQSYGLLMDPLNGVADIEMRQLRLVSNYGFVEEPARLLRATRLSARLAWEMDERTKVRFQNAKDEGAISSLSSYQRGYELEEIGHEEDGLRALAAMEAEGWMAHLYPAWTTSKADARSIEQMHQLLAQLQMQGVSPDISSVSMQLLTAKLSPKDLAELKKAFVRPGFVEEWDHLEAATKEFAKELSGKGAATPSAIWKLLTSANPQAVLWLGLTSKAPSIQNKYKDFFTVWPEARQKVPNVLMLEMRITPELPGYDELIQQLFFSTIDGKLETEEQLRAFLEPYSPPAPPPPVTVRRSRGTRKGESKAKSAAQRETEDAVKADAEAAESQEGIGEAGGTEQGKPATAPKKAKSAAKPESQPASIPTKSASASAKAVKPTKSPTVAKPSHSAQPAKKTAAPEPAKAANRPAPKVAAKSATKKSPPPAAKAHKKHSAAKKPAAGKKSKSTGKH